jgi:hypothetical protein
MMLTWILDEHVHLVGAGAPGQPDAALAAVAPDLEAVETHDADLPQGFLDVVELVFPDNGFDFF